jgi:hypothetical protein
LKQIIIFFLISDLYFFFEMSDLDVTQIHVSEFNLADSSSADDKDSVPPRKVTVSHLNRKFRDLQHKCEFQQTDMLMWLKADKAEREAKEEERLKREAIEKSERELREATERQEQGRKEAEARMMTQQHWEKLDRFCEQQQAQVEDQDRKIGDMEQCVQKFKSNLVNLDAQCVNDRSKMNRKFDEVNMEIESVEANVKKNQSQILNISAQNKEHNTRISRLEQAIQNKHLHESRDEPVNFPRANFPRNISVSPARDLFDRSCNIVDYPRLAQHFSRSVSPASIQSQINPDQTRVLPDANSSALIQIPYFAGDSDLSIFKRQCEIISLHNHWTDQILCIQIITKLKQKAAEILKLFPDIRQVTLRELWNALESRFGNEMQSDTARQQLSVYKQKKDQTFSHLSMEIQRLVFLAYPNGNEQIRDDIALEHFMKAISNQNLRFQVKLLAPQSILDAKNHAERIFSIMSSEFNSRNALLCNSNEIATNPNQQRKSVNFERENLQNQHANNSRNQIPNHQFAQNRNNQIRFHEKQNQNDSRTYYPNQRSENFNRNFQQEANRSREYAYQERSPTFSSRVKVSQDERNRSNDFDTQFYSPDKNHLKGQGQHARM